MAAQIDLTKIKFPSDSLSILDVRKRYPHHVDSRRSESVSPSLDDILSGIIDGERKLAEIAFHKAIGSPSRLAPYQESQRESVAEGYIEFGLARGPQHAAQLIRDIEVQATKQARARGSQRD